MQIRYGGSLLYGVGRPGPRQNQSKWRPPFRRVGLEAATQSSLGHWTAGNYPTAMTARPYGLSWVWLDCNSRPACKNIRRTIDYLTVKPATMGNQRSLYDNRYTYRHGLMLFLSKCLVRKKTKSGGKSYSDSDEGVEFSSKPRLIGGWGYVSQRRQ
jgi:hypothetical protein